MNGNRNSVSLINSIDILIIHIDSNEIIKIWNDEAEIFFNILKENAIGKKITELSIQWDYSVIKPYFSDRFLSEKLPDLPVIIDEKVKILGIRILRSHLDGIHNGFILIGRDLTQQRSLKQKQKNDRKMKTIGKLASGIAHEINTPTQYILNNLEFLNSQYAEPSCQTTFSNFISGNPQFQAA